MIDKKEEVVFSKLPPLELLHPHEQAMVGFRRTKSNLFVVRMKQRWFFQDFGGLSRVEQKRSPLNEEAVFF